MVEFLGQSIGGEGVLQREYFRDLQNFFFSFWLRICVGIYNRNYLRLEKELVENRLNNFWNLYVDGNGLYFYSQNGKILEYIGYCIEFQKSYVLGSEGKLILE